MSNEKNRRARILQKAEALINGDRQEDYGPPQKNFADIAKGWSVILGYEIKPNEVALCMAWLKIARACNGPLNEDSYVDLAGYAGLAGELAFGEDK